MSIAANHAQLQRQLYLLGYSQPLPEDGVVLVSTLLKDMQASLDRVKELEENSTRLEREERTSRAGSERLRGELHALRTENNQMRTEVLNYTRELDKIRREAREEAYKSAKSLDDQRLENLRLRAESAENRRLFDECQKRLEERVTDLDPGGRISRIVINRPAKPASFERGPASGPPQPPPAIVDLVDLSSRRISALEEEIGMLESKLRTTGAELSAAQRESKERDLEILRLNSAFEERGGRSDGHGDGGRDYYGADPVARLSDQVDYLHERAESLEKECQEQRDQFQKEKDELHRRWVQTENERVRLAERARDLGGAASDSDKERDGSQTRWQQQQLSAVSEPLSPAQTGELERLRTECSNIKSLYAQTRDQLQELLRTGSADTRRAREQASETEAGLRSELQDARQTSDATISRLERTVAELQKEVDDAPAHRELAQSRERQVAKLEKRLAKLGDRLDAAETAHAQETSRLSAQLAEAREAMRHTEQSAGERQKQYDSTVAEYRQLVDQHQKLDRSLRQAVAEVSEWRAKVDERDHRLGDTTRRLDEYRLIHKQDLTELRASRRTIENFSTDLATLRDAHDNAQRDVGRMREELEQAVKLRKAVEMSKDDYKRQLIKSLSESESHRALVGHLQAERRALRVQVKAQFHLSQRLEQRLEALDPSYAHEPLVPEASSSTLNLPRLPTAPHHRSHHHPRAASRSSSAAHSSRSFEDIPTTGSVGERYAAIKARLTESAALDTSESDSDSDGKAALEAASSSSISLP